MDEVVGLPFLHEKHVGIMLFERTLVWRNLKGPLLAGIHI